MESSLEHIIRGYAKQGELYEKLPDGRIRCFACGHYCPIPEGKAGVCRIRFNEKGVLKVPCGYVGALQDDPIEKKPFFHALPGARALSFGMLGCDFHCGYCQNWEISQTFRDPDAQGIPQSISSDEIVEIALAKNCQVLASTYNEPLITSEWAVEIFKKAKIKGLLTAYVSNGNATSQVLEYLKPWVDLYKVDLKSFNDANYRLLGGSLKNICESIRRIHEMDFWLEIVTLIIPGFNDSGDEIRRLVEFIASVSPKIPWHVTAFHKDYKMIEPANTTAEILLRTSELGRQAGLQYIYLGNLPGMVDGFENTYCAGCGELAIERNGYRILKNRLSSSKGKCPKCKGSIPGIWDKK